MIKGWLEETFIETFIKRLKPWQVRELKLKQPHRLAEAVRIEKNNGGKCLCGTENNQEEC